MHSLKENHGTAELKPKRILKRRNKEVLAIFEETKGFENVEWIDENEVQDVWMEPAEEELTHFPIISIEKHLECPWQNV